MLKEMLLEQSSNWQTLKANPGAWMMYEFIARHGIEMEGKPLPKRFTSGTPKYCFVNSIKLVRKYHKSNLSYVEGYAFNKSISFLFHHGWVIDKENNIIDVTLENPENYSYIGFKIDKKEYKQETKYSSSVFETMRGMNLKYFVRTDPSLLELVDDKLKGYLSN